MYFSIDRISQGRAVLIGEDGQPLEVPADMLPAGAREGDMVFYDTVGFVPAPDKTRERRSRVADMLGKLMDMPEDEDK